jgi:predicted dehydrogenase
MVHHDESLAQMLAPRTRWAGIVSCELSERDAPPAECDGVVFPGDLHTSEVLLVEHCLEAGRHVMLAADAGLTSEVLAKLIAAAERGKARLAVLNPERFLPSRQVIRQQFDAGKLGAPGLVRIHRWNAAAAMGEATLIPTSLLRELDVALWLIGSMPEVVFATGAEQFLQIHLGFATGGMALIDYASGLPAGDGYRSLSLIGSCGAAYADDHQNAQLLFRGGRPRALAVSEENRGWVGVVQHFVDGLNSGREFSAEATHWQHTLAVAEAARKSRETRQAVHWEDRGRE